MATPTVNIKRAAFQAAYDVWSGDSSKLAGSGNTTSFVRDFMRRRDTRVRKRDGVDRIAASPPYIILDIQARHAPAMGPGTSPISFVGWDVVWTFNVFTRCDLTISGSASDQDNIEQGIYLKFHEQSVLSSTLTGWSYAFSRPFCLGAGVVLAGTDDLEHRAIRYSVHVSEVKGSE